MLKLDSEFIRRSLCVVVPFLWLLVHGLCLAFGDVVCERVNSTTWVCSGTGGGGEGGPSAPPVVITNMLGVCTNCVSMTPSECESIKEQVTYYATGIAILVPMVNEVLEDTRTSIKSILDEGNQFTPVREWSLSAGTVKPYDSSQYNYVYNFTGIPGTGTNTGQGGTAVNSIANYYYTAVKPVLESSYDTLDNFTDGPMGSLLSYAQNLPSVPDQINCSECTASFGDGSSGGSGGGSGSGGSCTNCVCKEQLEALLKVLKGDMTVADDEKRRVESIASTVDRIKTGLNSFKKYVHDLFEGHTHISISDGNWTNVYLSGNATGFDYNKSNVLERIELLLWSLTSLNPSADQGSFLDGRDVNEIGDAVTDGMQGLESTMRESTNHVYSIRDSLSRLVSSFRPLGSSSSSSSSISRNILPHTDFDLGNDKFYVPDLIADSESFHASQGFFDALRLSFQVLYLAGSIYCVWVFWVFAWNKALFFVKWVGEVMTAFFG